MNQWFPFLPLQHSLQKLINLRKFDTKTRRFLFLFFLRISFLDLVDLVEFVLVFAIAIPFLDLDQVLEIVYPLLDLVLDLVLVFSCNMEIVKKIKEK